MMKISDMIAHLQNIQAEHGDLEVKHLQVNGGRYTTESHRLQVGYMKILNAKENIPRIWRTWEGESCKGEKALFH